MVAQGKYARAAVNFAFEAIGGQKRLAEVADRDPKWFFEKLFAKTIDRQSEVTQKKSVEDYIDAIDAESEELHTDVVDAEYEDA